MIDIAEGGSNYSLGFNQRGDVVAKVTDFGGEIGDDKPVIAVTGERVVDPNWIGLDQRNLVAGLLDLGLGEDTMDLGVMGAWLSPIAFTAVIFPPLWLAGPEAGPGSGGSRELTPAEVEVAKRIVEAFGPFVDLLVYQEGEKPVLPKETLSAREGALDLYRRLGEALEEGPLVRPEPKGPNVPKPDIHFVDPYTGARFDPVPTADKAASANPCEVALQLCVKELYRTCRSWRRLGYDSQSQCQAIKHSVCMEEYAKCLRDLDWWRRFWEASVVAAEAANVAGKVATILLIGLTGGAAAPLAAGKEGARRTVVKEGAKRLATSAR